MEIMRDDADALSARRDAEERAAVNGVDRNARRNVVALQENLLDRYVDVRKRLMETRGEGLEAVPSRILAGRETFSPKAR